MRQLALAVLLVLAVTAYAQIRTPIRRGNASTGSVILSSSSGIIEIASGVKGEPLSAERITETNRVLADGNQINRTTRSKVFRDSGGRTRIESGLDEPVEFQVTMIIDPVQQISISLITLGNKTALIHSLRRPDRTSTAAPTTSSASTTQSTPENRPFVSRALNERPVPPVREDLGSREIEGVMTRGTKTTRTIPAGKVGNEQPIVMVEESWFSPELRETVLSETDDPRIGHITRKLIDIQRTEPDPALFEVPPDYTVKED